MIYKVTCKVFVLMALLFSLTSVAEERPLTDDLINQYIQSLKNMEPLSDRINAEDTQDTATIAQLWMDGETSAITQHLKTRSYYAELEEVVQKSGFDSTADWVETAQRITLAFMALELSNRGTEVAAQMESSLQMIRDNEYLDDTQKDALIEQMKASQAHFSKLDHIDSADQAAIKPHLEKLRSYFETAQ